MTDTRTKIEVIEPILDATKSIAAADITSDIESVTAANGAYIENALENKDNSLQITITNSGAASKVIFKASDTYPNRVLGDLAYDIGANKTIVIMLHDISRFENKDKTIDIAFQTGFSGTMYAVAKHAGIRKIVVSE